MTENSTRCYEIYCDIVEPHFAPIQKLYQCQTLVQGVFERKATASKLKRVCRAVLTIINTGMLGIGDRSLYTAIKESNFDRQYGLSKREKPPLSPTADVQKQCYPYITVGAIAGILLVMVLGLVWTGPQSSITPEKNEVLKRKPTPRLHPTNSQARRTHHYHSTHEFTMDEVRAAEESSSNEATPEKTKIRMKKPRRLTKLQMATLVLVVLTFEEDATGGQETTIPLNGTAELRSGLLGFLETNLTGANYTYLPREKQTTFSFDPADVVEPPNLQGKKTTFFHHPNMGVYEAEVGTYAEVVTGGRYYDEIDDYEAHCGCSRIIDDRTKEYKALFRDPTAWMGLTKVWQSVNLYNGQNYVKLCKTQRCRATSGWGGQPASGGFFNSYGNIMYCYNHHGCDLIQSLLTQRIVVDRRTDYNTAVKVRLTRKNLDTIRDMYHYQMWNDPQAPAEPVVKITEKDQHDGLGVHNMQIFYGVTTLFHKYATVTVDCELDLTHMENGQATARWRQEGNKVNLWTNAPVATYSKRIFQQ